MRCSRIAIIGTGCVLLLAGCTWPFSSGPAVNPDPNHTHADFAVWVNGQKLDFSGEEYMSGSSAEEQGDDHPHEHRHEYLHLHDGNGDVVHRHKPGLTFGEFLESVDITIEPSPDEVRRDVNTRFCVRIKDGKPVCDSSVQNAADGEFALWSAWVNGVSISDMLNCKDGKCLEMDRGAEIALIWEYVFQDGDKILLDYGKSPFSPAVSETRERMKREQAQMTDDACLYSRTCPERGDPPTENCIADPAVPCVQ